MSSAIPDEWFYADLGSHINIGRGFAFKSGDYRSKGIPIVRVTNIGNDGRLSLLNNIVYIDRNEAESYSGYKLEADDVLIVMVGATVGKLAKVEKKYDGALLNQNMWRLFVKSKKNSSQEYLYHAIKPVVDKFLSTLQGSARGFLTQKGFALAEILLPPLPEQQKIATILSSVDDVIEKTRAQVDKLKDLKTGMMQELLTKGIGHTEFKDSPVGRIPESWSVVRLGDITVEHKQGYYSKERYSENGTYVIRITDMASPKISFTEMPKMVISKDEVEAYRVKEGDFLFARSGAIGRYGIYESKNQAVFASYLIRFRFDPERCINYFIGYCYESDFCQHQIASITQGSSNININANNIKDIMIPLPSVSEQNKICIRLKSLDKRIDLLSLKYQQLNSIKKALMQDLLTGKVRVNLIDKESAVV